MNYSQNDEEKIILDYFKGKTGTLLSIGENDGVTLSNVRALIEIGWRGTLLEPSPIVYDKLQTLYKNSPEIQTIPYALGTKNGTTILNVSGALLGANDHSLVSSIIPEETVRWKNAGIEYEEVRVPVITFKKLMELSKYKTFDFISFDAEGVELDVLPHIDFNKLQTRLICIEWNGKNFDKFCKHFTGFFLIHKNAENLIWAK